jgi:hypothetical protein
MDYLYSSTTQDHVTTSNSPQELSIEELKAVNGGILPAIGVAAALASHIGVGAITTSAAGHFITGFGLGFAVFSAASYYGGASTKPVKNTMNH